MFSAHFIFLQRTKKQGTMKMIDFPEANVTMNRNENDPAQVNTYDARACQTEDGDKNPVTVVCFKPTPEDVKRWNSDKDSAKLWLMISGHRMPPLSLQTSNPFRTDGENYPDYVPLFAMPVPTPLEMDSPLFKAIYSLIKTWDIRVPECYGGYTIADGRHVKMIMDVIDARGLDIVDAKIV